MKFDQAVLGRLVQSSITGFTFACAQQTITRLSLGALIRAEVSSNLSIYALTADISWPGDEMIYQLARSPQLQDAIVTDNQYQRGMGPIIQAIIIGYRDREIHQALAPQPASSLTEILLCSPSELVKFTGSLAYFRLIINASENTPMADLIAAHLQYANEAHRSIGDTDWVTRATRRLANFLRTDYDRILEVFEAISQRLDENNF